MPTLMKIRIPQARRVAAPLMAAALALAISSCRREEISHARVAKAPAPAAASPAMPPPATPAQAGTAAQPPEGGASALPAGAKALKWKLPKGWTEAGAGGMRYATLKPGTPGKIDVSVVVLPGVAGGELANVNRWRGQIGLPPVDEAALAAARKPLEAKAGTISLYDFKGEGQEASRMVAGLVAAGDGNTWFVKMVGEAGPVGAARPDFIKLLETLRFD